MGYYLKAFLLTVLLILLGLNNPYLLAISCSLILACSGIGLLAYLMKRNISIKLVISWFFIAIISLLVTQGILHSLDTVTDRVKVPFGFFENVASFKGLFFPNETWLAKPLSYLFSQGPNSFESRSYIGFIPLLTLLSLPLLWLRKRAFFKSLFGDNNLGIIFLGSIAVLVFAFGEPFSMIKEWSLAHLGQVLQFRAPGRFSWVFYFGIALLTATALSKLYEQLKEANKPGIIIAIFIPILLFWSIDVHQFLSWRTEKKIHHNAFSPDQLVSFYKLAEEKKLNDSNYHGIYLLPTEHGWTDKVFHEGSWRSNYDGYRLSLASGLPLINGKLSRVSLSRTLNSMQLVSNPIIKRKLLDLISSDKSILLLKAGEAELSPYENDLFENAETIYSNKHYSLAKVDISELKSGYNNLKSNVTTYPNLNSKPLAYKHFEESSAQYYAGKGCYELGPGKQLFFKSEIPQEYRNDTLDISFWYYVDPSISGGPWWTIQSLSEDKVLTELREYSLDILDTQNGWLRVEFILPLEESANELALYSEYRHRAYIDELLIKRKLDTITYQIDGSFYYNNFLIE